MAKRKLKKYRGVKFGGDDPYSWAVFLAEDIKGLRSPISEYTKAKPFYSGLNQSQKNYYIKLLEEADEKK
jgi:hypothetical protein